VLDTATRAMVTSDVRGDSAVRAPFEGEVLPHAPRLFRLAKWLERNPEDAVDVLKDTMMQALN
jgi:DNA-directed RNA polymerase specialized sigma24 family protein